MKNLKEQYSRFFGKLTERAKTSDSDVKQFIRLMKGVPGGATFTPKQVVDFVNKYDKPGRPVKAEHLFKIAKAGRSNTEMIRFAIRGKSEGDRQALRELDRYYKKYSDEKKGFL